MLLDRKNDPPDHNVPQDKKTNNMNEGNIMELIDNRQDVLSDILGFCGGSYMLSGRVSRKWNSVYKMRNKTTTTSAKHCTSINSIWDFLEDETIIKTRSSMLALFETSRTLDAQSIGSKRKIIRIKNIFIRMFRWSDDDLIQYSNECVDALQSKDTHRDVIGKILEEIVMKANQFNNKGVMFEIMTKYYACFPEKRRCNVFTFVIAQYRFLDILVEYVEKYEGGTYNMCVINKSTNEEIKEDVRQRACVL